MHDLLTIGVNAGRCLTPEEDAIGDPDEQDDEIDDLMPADLWFRLPHRITTRS